MRIENWYGGQMRTFTLDGRRTIVVTPEKAREGNPWVWRMEFFGAFASVDADLLKKGFIVAYHSASNMYGCPESIAILGRFQDYMERTYGVSEKPALFGFSRGGLYAVNYALTYPDRVGAIYLDAPVLDFRSWPGCGRGYDQEWRDCLACYHLTEENARMFHQTPLNRAEELAALRIPLIVVAGESDRVVPVSENLDPFERRYRNADGQIAVIRKPSCDHHPHSLTDPSAVSAFLLRALGYQS